MIDFKFDRTLSQIVDTCRQLRHAPRPALSIAIDQGVYSRPDAELNCLLFHRKTHVLLVTDVYGCDQRHALSPEWFLIERPEEI